MSSRENKIPRKAEDVIGKAILSAGKAVTRLLVQKEKSQAENDDSVRSEISVGTEVSLSADSHRHGGGGGVLKTGEIGFVVALEGTTKARVRSQTGNEHIYETAALKAFARTSRAASLLVESVYFPALAAMLFDACTTNAGLKAVLLKQAAAYAKSLRPLELFGESSCRESLQRVVEFLLNIIRDGASQSRSPTADAKVAFESLIALAAAEGSVARNIQLALVACAHPSLIEPQHLKGIGLLAEGVSAGEEAPSVRASAFSAALDTALQAGKACSPVQACAAVMAQIELLLGEAEHARKHRGKVPVPHISEVNALRPLIDFIDFVGGSKGLLDSPDLAWSTVTRGQGFSRIQEQAALAHTTRREVAPSSGSSVDGGGSPEEVCSDREGLAIIFNSAMRLVAANLALSIHVDDALEAAPVENLERVRGLLRTVVQSATYSDFFGELGLENRLAVRELALISYDVGGEAFFKDALVMIDTARAILQGASQMEQDAPAAGASDDGALDIAVLKILARPQILLPLLLSAESGVRRSMVEVVNIVSEIQFRELGYVADVPVLESAPSSNFETVDADWNWGLCHRDSIQLSKDDRRVYKSNSSPDYSCAMSSEPFTEGVHSWEVLFEATCSTWVGIAGETTKDYLGSSPVIEYGATLHNGGSWNLYGGLNCTKQESASFCGGTRVSMVLDFEQGLFDMYVDSVHKLSISNIEPNKPLYAYICMDGSGECSELTTATKQTVCSKCTSLTDAIRLVGSSIVRLETGLSASAAAEISAENYGEQVLAKFCYRLESFATDINSGRVATSTIGDSLSSSASQLCFENVVALASQMCSSPILGGNLLPIARMVQATHGIVVILGLKEDAWLSQYLHALVSVLGAEMASVIWGDSSAGSERDREDWFNSQLFVKGLLASPVHIELMVSVGEPSIFDNMLQPRIAVHTSPYLDQLERDVVIAVLYQIGAIEQFISLGNESSEDLVATCQNAAILARQVRRHVMEVRNLANQSLAEDEKPKDWDFFVKPFIDKCHLLLQVPSLCPMRKAVSSNSQRRIVAAALLIKQRSSKTPTQNSEWDKILTTMHAAKVYRRMHSQIMCHGPQTKAIAILSKFLRDGETSAGDLRKKLQDNITTLPPGLKSCSALDTLASIIKLGDASILHTALHSMFQSPQKGKSSRDPSTSTDVSMPIDWLPSIVSQVTASSNASDVLKVIDGDSNSYWQSSGSCPHWIKLHLDVEDVFSEVRIIVSSQDGSYCPAMVRVLVGTDENDLHEVGEHELQVSGVQSFAFQIEHAGLISLVQLKIERNQSGGSDTRVRGLFLSKGGSFTKAIWNEAVREGCHQNLHYLVAGRGNNEPELRSRFNQCIKALIDVLEKEIENPQSPVCRSLMNFLGIKMDRADIDFLASCSIGSLLEKILNQFDSHISNPAQQNIPLEPEFVQNFASYGVLLKSMWDQVVRLDAEANPIIRKTVADVIFASLSKTLIQMKFSATRDAKIHVEEFSNLLLSSICVSASTSTVLCGIASQKWQDLLWKIAESDIQEKIRLAALQLIRSIVLSEKPVGMLLNVLAERAINLISISSPESVVINEHNAKAVPNLVVRAEAVSLVESLLESSWGKEQVTNILMSSIQQSACSKQFLATILFFGGRLDLQQRDYDCPVKSLHAVSSLSQHASALILDRTEPLLSRSTVLCSENANPTEELIAVVASTRVVKTLWEYFPIFQTDLVQRSGLVSNLIKLAIEPCPVPFFSEQGQGDATGSASWTWGPCEPNNILILDNGLTAKNQSGSGPDYSCVLGSETLSHGTHIWEIEVQNVNSLWLGISRGVQEADGLGSSPGQHGDFQLYFSSGGSCGHKGATPAVEIVSASGTGFSSGQKVKFELNIDARSLCMSVNDDMKYVCQDVDCGAGVVPYMCSDYTESVTIVSRMSSVAERPNLIPAMLITKTHTLLANMNQAINSSTTTLEGFLGSLELNSPEILASTLQKLNEASISLDELTSSSMTSDRLKSAGVLLGPRKAILEKRSKEAESTSLRPNLQKARALARMCHPMLPLSRCVTALRGFNESGDLFELANSIQSELAISDNILASSNDLYKKANSDNFVKEGTPRAPSSISSPQTEKLNFWSTRGSASHLAFDVERSLLTIMSRLVVHDLLAIGHVTGVDAETVEQILARSFLSVDHPQPRPLSHIISDQNMQLLLSRSVLGWVKVSHANEVDKLQGLALGALTRYAARQSCLSDRGDSANENIIYPESEEDLVESGIGFALVVLSSFVEAKRPVLDLTEALAKCILLTTADSCPKLLGAVCSALKSSEEQKFSFGEDMQKALQILRNALVTMIINEQGKVRAGIHHSPYLQSIQDCVSCLELMSLNVFDESGKLKWGFSGEVSKEMSILFNEDLEICRVLANNNISSFSNLLTVEEETLKNLPLNSSQIDILKALKQKESRFFFLPGDVVQLASLASFSLEPFLQNLEFSSQEVQTETLQKLRSGNVTIEDLLSPLMTTDRLKTLGIPLGPRKAIMMRREMESTFFKVANIQSNGTYQVTSDSSESKEAHHAQLSHFESGKLALSLEELGSVDREVISRVLLSLKLNDFDSGLETEDGQKLIDRLTTPCQGDSCTVSDDNSTQGKARQKIEEYTKVLAALRSLRLQRPFPVAFEAYVKTTLSASNDGEASWIWGPYEPSDISITEEGLKATKNYVTGPDYSCAIGSEPFEDGIHTWEIEVNNSKQTSYSMWLGIARGVEERGGLALYPSNESCAYLVAFGCSGSDIRQVGKEHKVDIISSYQFSAGQKVKFELDMNEHILQLSVDGTLAVIVHDIDDEGVRPYVCMDYSESALILSRTCTKQNGPEGSALITCVVSEEDLTLALNNALWTEEVDSALIQLPWAGKVTFYDDETLVELRNAVDKIGERLETKSIGSVAARLNVHAIFKKMLLRVMPLINLDNDKTTNYLFEELQQVQSRISMCTFANLFQSAVQIAQSRNKGNYPTVKANRGIVPAEQRKREKTVFFQIFQQIGTGSSKALLNGYSANDAGKQFWKISFEGEGGIDAGGLFRDSVREICAELQSEGSLKLLIPCPNQKRMANGLAGWIVNPALGDKQHLEMYQFIGTLMGASLLWEASVELDLPGLFWKQLIGQKANWSDLVALDEGFCKKILDSRAASADEWVASQQTWVVVTSTGRLAELRRGGAVIPVTFNEKETYLDACVDYRLSEGRKQIQAIRSGFFSLVPTIGLQFLDWHQVEKLVCGTPIIDIEILKKITSYNNMPGDASHPVAAMFWNVMDGFTNEERAQVMAFTWGRRRMPPQIGGVHFKMCVDASLNDRHMPRSHTCFFAIDLPNYTKEETLRAKLLYAATYCTAIDNDSSASGQLYTECYDVNSQDDYVNSVLPFELNPPKAGFELQQDGGHCPFLQPGSKARAAKKNGGKKSACTIIGPVAIFGEWDTCPVRYRVQWDDTLEEGDMFDDNAEAMK